MWTAHWVYWAAPLLGAGLAVVANGVLNPAQPLAAEPHQVQEFRSGPARRLSRLLRVDGATPLWAASLTTAPRARLEHDRERSAADT
nr:hypothetical protein [Deinococcus irradiatisoli]